MNTPIAIQETDLQLVVSEQTLGHLVTNAKLIRDTVVAALPKYDIANYNADNIDLAKKDKAMLNKAAKVLNDKRIEVEREFMKPFAEFKEIVAETVKNIAECSTRIDLVVKQSEQQERDTKLAAIRQHFDENNVNLIDFARINRPEWLNKTMREKAIFAEIDTRLATIDTEISTLQAMTEDADVLLTYYKDTLNLASTMQYANRLREQRERVRQAEAARLAPPPVAAPAPVAPTRHVWHPAPAPIAPEPAPQPSVAPAAPVPVQPQETEALLTRAFTVTTTRENIIALGNFMNERGIDFDRIDLDTTLCRSDLQTIARLLESGIALIGKHCQKPAEMDKARQMTIMLKKLNGKTQ